MPEPTVTADDSLRNDVESDDHLDFLLSDASSDPSALGVDVVVSNHGLRTIDPPTTSNDTETFLSYWPHRRMAANIRSSNQKTAEVKTTHTNHHEIVRLAGSTENTSIDFRDLDGILRTYLHTYHFNNSSKWIMKSV